MEEAPFDDALAEGVRVGDPDALAALWRLLAPPLVRWLRFQVRDHHLAEDLADDTFLDLVRARGTITGDAFQIRGWLFRAARRNLLDHRRRESRRLEDCRAELPERPATTLGPAEAAEAGEVEARVRGALAHITKDQRHVITLRFLHDLSGPEVATRLGMTEGGVRALQHRGLASLSRVMRAGAVPAARPSRVLPPV
jgi:RNA polymerase sigma-70 factor (ECF subfamily)